MAEQMMRIESVFTYTYDQFTVFFCGDHVYIDGKEFPIGQCAVDVMNLDESVLDEIDRRVWEAPTARRPKAALTAPQPRGSMIGPTTA